MHKLTQQGGVVGISQNLFNIDSEKLARHNPEENIDVYKDNIMCRESRSGTSASKTTSAATAAAENANTNTSSTITSSSSSSVIGSGTSASDSQKLAEAPLKPPSKKKKSLRVLNSLSNSLRFDNVSNNMPTVSPTSDHGM
jgi:hypothetical protein